MRLYDKIYQLMIPRILIFFVLLISSVTGVAQKKDMIDTALIPFWKTTTMHNESVLMISRDRELPEANLLFTPYKILSVRNAELNMNYKEGIDWEYAEGRLRLLKGSKAAFLTDTQLYSDSSIRSFPKRGGGFILFNEGLFFHTHQLAVTYTHSTDLWKGPVPPFQARALREVLRKLKRRTLLQILLFGDSIAAGANASGVNNAFPHLSSWGNLFAEKLRRYYKGKIAFTNTAVGGKDSHWGLKTVQERVIDHNPDLVIIAFGMNDGTARIDPKVFKANIEEMINKIRQHNAKTAFILVAPMLPNPESNFVGTQESLKKVLEELTGKGIILVDMTSVHIELLKYKSYQDMTGNNINHPNDFLIRWYAQQISSVLIPDRKL